MFNNAGTVVNWVDESFGSGCPTMTTYQPRPWNPAGGTHKTGKMFFTDMEGSFLSEFHVGDLRPDPGATEYCSAHMGMAVMGIKRDLLVNAWYTGGVDVIDFSKPTRLKEIAYYDPRAGLGHLVGVPVHRSAVQARAREGPGLRVRRRREQRHRGRAWSCTGRTRSRGRAASGLVDHLNPQTMDHMMMADDDDDDDRGKGKGRDGNRDDDD